MISTKNIEHKLESVCARLDALITLVGILVIAQTPANKAEEMMTLIKEVVDELDKTE